MVNLNPNILITEIHYLLDSFTSFDNPDADLKDQALKIIIDYINAFGLVTWN